MSREIALVEDHDAVLAELAIGQAGEGRLVFQHIAAYHAAERERFEIRSHPARLELRGVQSLSLEGRLDSNEYVSDSQVLAADGRSISWTELLGRREVQSLEIQFGSGATLRLECQEAELLIDGEGSFQEIWEGPL